MDTPTQKTQLKNAGSCKCGHKYCDYTFDRINSSYAEASDDYYCGLNCHVFNQNYGESVATYFEDGKFFCCQCKDEEGTFGQK